MKLLATLAPRLLVPSLLTLLASVPATAQSATPAATPSTPPVADIAMDSKPPLAIALIEWHIKKGQEKDFLDYWAVKSTIGDRTGLIGEFLSSERDAPGQFPWINWQIRSTPEYTVFYNVGIWKSAGDYVEQIGKYADNAKAPMPFEYDHRRRVLIEPFEWRRGPVSLPEKDAAGVH